MLTLKKVKVACTKCNYKTEFRLFSPLGSGCACPECSGELVEQLKSGKSDNQKRSQQQEKRAAKKYGGKTQPASGAMKHAKGDLRDKDKTRGECKFTRAMSYSIKLDDVMKIEEEAAGTEVPYLEIEFQGVHPYRRVVVLPDWAFEYLLSKGESRDSNDD